MDESGVRAQAHATQAHATQAHATQAHATQALTWRRLAGGTTVAAVAVAVVAAAAETLGAVVAGRLAEHPAAGLVGLLAALLVGSTLLDTAGRTAFSGVVAHAEGRLRADLLHAALHQPLPVLEEQAVGDDARPRRRRRPPAGRPDAAHRMAAGPRGAALGSGLGGRRAHVVACLVRLSAGRGAGGGAGAPAHPGHRRAQARRGGRLVRPL